MMGPVSWRWSPVVFDETNNGQGDVFAARLNSMGTGLIYATFLGGLGDDAGQDVAVDTSGCAYLTGLTASADFPATSGVFDETHNGQDDVFVVRLDPAATVLGYATFLGGGGNDGGYGIVLDSAGCAYLTGLTESSDFPVTVGAFDESYNGLGDVFVAKLSSGGNSLVNATYVGGGDLDQGYGIALDADGYVHLTGLTRSNDFPATGGAFDPTHNGNQDAFVCKLDMAAGDLTPPEAIDDLTIDVISGAKVSSGDIHLLWSEPYDDVGVVRYVIFRSTVAGNLGYSLAGTADTAYMDAGAAGDTSTNYYYAVKAADAAGNKSGASNQVGEFDVDLLNAPSVK